MQVADFTVIGLDWRHIDHGIEFLWTAPDDADLDSPIILQYKVRVWFESPPVSIHIDVNGHLVTKAGFFGSEGYSGPMYHILAPTTFFPGVQNRIRFTVVFGEGFEGPSGQEIGRVVLFWHRKV